MRGRRISPSAARRANHIACRTRKKPPVRKTLSAPYTRKKQERTGGKQKTRNKPAARRTENPPLAKYSTARHVVFSCKRSRQTSFPYRPIIGADAALPAALTAPAVLGNCLFFDPRVQCVHWSALLLSKLPQKIGLEHNSTSLASETACLLFRCKSRNKCGFRQRLRVKPLHLSVPLAKVFRVH